LEGFIGYDPHLDDAIRTVVDEANAMEDDEDDAEYYEDED